MLAACPRHSVETGGLDELHRVVDRESSGYRAARRIDVEADLLFRVFRLQKEQLRGDQVGDVVVDRMAQKDDPILEQPRIDVVGAFAAARLLDDHRNQVDS